jgi:hypothetical protein
LWLCGIGPAYPTWKPEFGVSPPDWIKWFNSAETTPAARERIHFQKCCDHADRLKTKFKATRSGEDWYYEQDGAWKLIPRDVIHHEPDPTMPAQLKNEGVLFIFPPVSGEPTCFWPPESGI